MAAHLLATTSMDMAEIAERCGFPNSAYFSRVFRKITMESPTRFRRKARVTLLGEGEAG
jgi:transcriptional regulator GlxA family with amidase domain